MSRGVPVETITSSRDIDALFRRGRRSRRTTLVVLCRTSPEGSSPDGRVVFVAGRRLGNAVMRNRCKRVMRATIRRTGAGWAGYDVALIATSRTAEATPELLERDLASGIAEVGADA